MIVALDKIHTRTYDGHSGGHDHEGSVAELHWPDGRVVQISGATENDSRGSHVLIRVWPKDGTVEYGGGNITSFSMLLRPDGDGWSVHSLHIDGKYLDHYRTDADA